MRLVCEVEVAFPVPATEAEQRKQDDEADQIVRELDFLLTRFRQRRAKGRRGRVVRTSVTLVVPIDEGDG